MAATEERKVRERRTGEREACVRRSHASEMKHHQRMRVHGEERQEPKNIRKAEEITKMSDTYMERQMRHRRCSRTIPAQMQGRRGWCSSCCRSSVVPQPVQHRCTAGGHQIWPPEHLQRPGAALVDERRRGEADGEARPTDGETKKKGGQEEPWRPTSCNG